MRRLIDCVLAIATSWRLCNNFWQNNCRWRRRKRRQPSCHDINLRPPDPFWVNPIYPTQTHKGHFGLLLFLWFVAIPRKSHFHWKAIIYSPHIRYRQFETHLKMHILWLLDKNLWNSPIPCTFKKCLFIYHQSKTPPQPVRL